MHQRSVALLVRRDLNGNNAARVAVRHFTRVLLLCSVGHLVGCATLSLPPSELVGPRGGQATLVQNVGVAFKVVTASVAPGKAIASNQPWTNERCEVQRIVVVISSALGPESKLGSLCFDVAKAIDDTRGRIGAEHVNYSLRLYLVPEGSAIRSRWSHWATTTDARATFMFPWFSDEMFARSNIVSTAAHESFHLLGAIAGIPERVRLDESLAYVAGACAQFSSMDKLRYRDLPVTAIDEAERGADDSIARSSRAGADLREVLEPLFGADGQIIVGTEAGKALKEMCRMKIDHSLAPPPSP